MLNNLRLVVTGVIMTGALALQGCASVSTMESRDMSAAPAQTFNAGKAAVVQATEASIKNLDYTLQSVKPGEPVTQVYFSKPMSAFSWGEVGRIDVKSLSAEQTQVIVGSEKRYQMQLTGTTQKEFAETLFGSIQKNLR